MKISTTHQNNKSIFKRLLFALFWVVIWEIFALILGSDIILPTPQTVIKAFVSLLCTKDFYGAVVFSVLRIFCGFLAGLFFGSLFSTLSYRYSFFEELLRLPIAIIKATPVTSFVILLLVWISAKNLSVFISSIIVLPIVYENVLEGLKATDKKLLEMAFVFRMKPVSKVRFIYMPLVKRYINAACKTAVGLGFKAGVAAEVVGLSRGSIGERIYMSKIYLEISMLFAWTITVVLLSVFVSKIVVALIDKITCDVEGK